MKTDDHDNSDLNTSQLEGAIGDLRAEKADLDRRIDALKLARETLDWDEDQPRDEGGRWATNGGAATSSVEKAERTISGSGASQGKRAVKEPSKGLKNIAESLGKSFVDVDKGSKGAKELSAKERDVLKKFGQSKSDKQFMKATGLSLNDSHKALNAIREKMGLTPMDDLRKAAKEFKEPSEGLKDIAKTFDPKTSDRLKPANTKAQTSVEPKEWHGQAKGHSETEKAFAKSGKYPPERRAHHEAYAKEAINPDLPKSDTPTFNMTGGGFAAGKTTALLKNPLVKVPSKEEAAYLSADDARHYIPEYKEGVKAKDPTAATFVQEEASHTAKQALEKAIKAGHDTMYDSSGDSGVDGLEKKITQYREWGVKKVVANYATIDVEEAIKRSDERAKAPGPDQGRLISHEYIRSNHQNVAETVLGAIERKLFDNLDVWSNDPGIGHPFGKGPPPLHLATYTKEGGLKVHDKDGWEKFKSESKGES